MINQKPRSHYLISAIVAFISIGLAIVIIISYIQTTTRTAGLTNDLKLKVAKGEIVNYKLSSDSVGNQVVLYRYVSNQEVSATTFQGLTEDLAKRTPNSQAFLKSIEPIDANWQKEQYIAKFYPQPILEQKGNKWYQVEVATTTPAAFTNQTKLTLFDQVKGLLGQPVLADTFFSGAGDGYIQNSGVATWSTVHDALTGTSAVPTNSQNYTAVQESSGQYAISRSFLPFDTSAIPSSANISSATLSVYAANASSPGGSDGFDYLNIVQTTQPDSTTLTTDDFDLCGGVSNPPVGATALNLDAMTDLVYNTFTLDATGLTWIAKNGDVSSCGATTGFTCLGIREGHDLTNNTIQNSTVEFLISYASEQTGTSQDPYLTVTYTSIADALKINGGTIKVNGNTLKIN